MFSLKYSELVKHIIVIAPAFEEAECRYYSKDPRVVIPKELVFAIILQKNVVVHI